MRARFGRFAAAFALIGTLVVATSVAAQVKKGKTRPLTTHQLMEALVGPSTGALSKSLEGTGPTDDKGWSLAATRASLLNESAHILMADGRCPDATWAGACKTLDDCSKVVLTKIEAKDAAGARDAFKAMTMSCAGCHAAHKK